MIERLQAQDVAEAAGVLARAFLDNPAMVAVLRGDPPALRLRLIERGMRGFAEAVQRHGLAEVSKQDGRITGVALSFPPGAYPPPLRAELIIARGPIMAGARRALRFSRLDRALRKRHPDVPHWYLWLLGVEPELQGRGFGSALLRSLSAHAEGGRSPCYLETDRAANVRLYQRHGYALLREEVLPLETKFWFMRREPKAAGG